MSTLAKISANKKSLNYLFTGYENKSSAGTIACYKQLNKLSWEHPGRAPQAALKMPHKNGSAAHLTSD